MQLARETGRNGTAQYVQIATMRCVCPTDRMGSRVPMGTSTLSAIQSLIFFPRGGSAQVIRYLVRALEEHNAQTLIISGSLGKPGDQSHAQTFFAGLQVEPVDYSEAFDAHSAGADPLTSEIPLHPSYEDRPGVADRIFTAVDPRIGKYLESRWTELLAERVDNPPDIFHVHHLTPMQPAVRTNWPDHPLIGHIHGTELKMLAAIRDRGALLDDLELDFDSDPDLIRSRISGHWEHLDEHRQRIAINTRWESWLHARYWQRRLREYAGMCDWLFVLTPDARDQVVDLLGFDADRIVPVPNGVDTERFQPDRLTAQERLSRWRHWLTEEPQGWDETGVPGSVSYTRQEVDQWFMDASGDRTPVLFFVGRFMSMKRVPLLIRAYNRAQASFRYRAPLVIWGGNPGEWEYEHPVAVARDEQVEGVFFVGWRGHEELPEGLNAADVMVAPSTNEPFGQVYLEAMACELPVIATRSGGPPSFLNTDSGVPDAWLVPPDDEAALADVLIEAVNDPDGRRQRGRNALASVRSSYSWEQIAGQVRELYDSVLDSR